MATSNFLIRLVVVLRLDTLQDLLLFLKISMTFALIVLDSGLDPLTGGQTLTFTSLSKAEPLHHWTIDWSQLQRVLWSNEIQNTDSVQVRLIRWRRDNPVDAAL